MIPEVAKPVWRAGDQANAEQFVDMAGTINCNKGSRGGIVSIPQVTNAGWRRVSFAGDCPQSEGWDDTDEPGDICSICGLDYCDECQCPGPTQDGMEYREIDGILHARPECQQIARALRAEHDASEDGNGRGTPLVPVAFYPTNRQPEFGNYENISPTVKVGSGGTCGNPPAIAFERRMVRTTGGQPQEELNHCLRADANTGDGAPCVAYGMTTAMTPKFAEEVSPTLMLPSDSGGGQVTAVATPYAVRRLTPTECERLQGFPDSHTKIPWRGKPAEDCPDGPRYKALGNSMAVPVMHWIGQRIEKIQTLTQNP